jgi:quinoprotein glucose dehydrogenase
MSMPRWPAALCLSLAAAPLLAVPPDAKQADPAANTDATHAIANFRIPPGTSVDLFAGDNMLANPVAFCIDEKGRVYVAESFRQSKGIEDNRQRGFWLIDDLAATKIEDRLAKYHKYADKFGGFDYFTKYHEQVSVLTDTDGDGHADESHVFAGPFREPLDGSAAGLIARDGCIYMTCIPNLWRLKDTKGEGKADVQEKLATGFGVRDALRGHDLHGLAWGPDGKLYFSLGDRGYNVTTKEGKHLEPPMDHGRGAVFRCNPDGSELETYYTGLRNPQELAFDDFGNLFTVDNNSDSGDQARLVYIIEGGDTGWDMSFQTLEGDYSRGPWTQEKIWYPRAQGGKVQPAWINPPTAWITAGPSGFTHYPGVGLDPKYNGHFFIVDFRGGAGGSGVLSFAVKNKGAGFEMVDAQNFWTNVLATDVDFGYDGKMYLTDWISGWDGTGKGRIYTLKDDKHIEEAKAAGTGKLFAEGFNQRPTAELITLLGHVDYRVRQRAQFALADRGKSGGDNLKETTETSSPIFSEVARALAGVMLNSKNPSQKLHALWGLGQLGPKGLLVSGWNLFAHVHDGDPEFRAQLVKLLGDTKYFDGVRMLIPALKDPSPRVRMFAGIALGKIGDKSAIEPLIKMLAENKDEDANVRHAAVMGLHGVNDASTVFAHATDPDVSVRMGVLLALRHYNDVRIAQMLNDADPLIVVEAARAINDLPLPSAMPALAALIDRVDSLPMVPETADALLRRVINANFRAGTPAAATALSKLIANAKISDISRREAIRALADWQNPSPRDRVLGFYRPLPQNRDIAPVTAALQGTLPSLVKTRGPFQNEATQLASRMHVALDEASLFKQLTDATGPVANRVESLRAILAGKSPKSQEAIDTAMKDADPTLRAEARRLFAAIDPSRGCDSLALALDSGEIVEKQSAFAVLGAMKYDAVDPLLAKQLQLLSEGKLDPQIQLDCIEAAKLRSNPDVKAKLAAYTASLDAKNPLAPFKVALTGGNAERGRDIFNGHPAAQCTRCHMVNNVGGNVGPDLSKVASRAQRDYFLESLIDPSAKIAPGYGTIAVTLKNGQTAGGLLRSESAAELVVVTPDNKEMKIAVKDIATRTPLISAMPPMAFLLKPAEVRDVIEYLATLK